MREKRWSVFRFLLGVHLGTIFFWGSFPVFALENSAAQFLKIPLSARASGMAAFGAVAEDANAIFYNPCLLYTSPSPRD